MKFVIHFIRPMIPIFRNILPVILLLAQACKDEPVFPDANTPTEFESILVEELETIIVPVSDDTPDAPMSELEGLDGLAGSRIIGLGEASHGTSEFFRMKDRLFRYFHQQHGFSVFLIEADFGESMYFDRYIRGLQSEDLTDMMEDHMLFWTWKTAEVHDMIEWMHNRNATLGNLEKIRYFGVDCQTPLHNVDMLVDLLEPLDAEFADSVYSALIHVRMLEYSENTSIAQREEHLSAIAYVINGIETRADDLATTGSAEELELIRRLARVVEQCEIVQWAYVNDPGQNPRDSFMAENAAWVMEYLGPESQGVLWAHNLHVQINESWDAMGHYLSETYTDAYQVIGFAFSGGTITAVHHSTGLGTQVIQENPKMGSLNRILHFSEPANYYFYTDSIPAGSELRNWLTTKSPELLNIGAVYNGSSYVYYYPVELLEQYDVLIYFDNGNASDLL